MVNKMWTFFNKKFFYNLSNFIHNFINNGNTIFYGFFNDLLNNPHFHINNNNNKSYYLNIMLFYKEA